MAELKLIPNKDSYKNLEDRYNKLIGLDEQKADLLFNLKLILDTKSLNKWETKHHPKGLSFLNQHFRFSPLLILSGEVGCGKTELANCIAGPLVNELGGKTVRTFSTPSDVRGGGLVGQLSSRITESFDQMKKELKKGEKGILILDEADDLATSRDQQQAHHEDKAGVNALVKEIDNLGKNDFDFAVILISNRSDVMDPAILRRAIIEVFFDRPLKEDVKKIIEYLLDGTNSSFHDINRLVEYCITRSPLFSFSDFFNRIGTQVIKTAYQTDQAFSFKLLEETIFKTKPSPTIIKS